MTSHRPNKARRNIILGIVVVALICITAAVLRNQPSFRAFPKRLATVDPGVLYRSSQPNTRQIEKLVRKYGLRTLLIVREGSSHRVPDEIAFARASGLNAVKIPVKSRQVIPDEDVRAFFACVDDAENHPVLIHCSAGRHRTGYLCAMYRIERQGWTVEQAIEEMLSFGFDTESQQAVLEQLRQYQPGRFSMPASQTKKSTNHEAKASP